MLSYEFLETASLLAYLGQPLPPLSTLPKASVSTISRPTTPSRLFRQIDDEEEESLSGQLSEWSLSKKEEMSRRLGQLIEELVRTERSYYGRVEALKTVGLSTQLVFVAIPGHPI